jgi:hypothetical protein
MPCGSTPAEYASITSALSARAQPSAIWLRHELPVQRNITFNLLAMSRSFQSKGSIAVRAFHRRQFANGSDAAGGELVEQPLPHTTETGPRAL